MKVSSRFRTLGPLGDTQGTFPERHVSTVLGRRNFSWEKDDWKIFAKKKNVSIAFNILNAKKEKIYPANVSKHNSDREKQVILLMIPNREEHQAKSGEQP